MEGDITKAWLPKHCIFGSKGHILHVVGSLYYRFVTGNPVSSLRVTRSHRQFCSYLPGQRQRGLATGPLLPGRCSPRCGDEVPAGVAVRSKPALHCIFPRNPGRSRRLGHLKVGHLRNRLPCVVWRLSHIHVSTLWQIH